MQSLFETAGLCTYETSCVRRLGYLLERANHPRQADALDTFARKAKTAALIGPAAKPQIPDFARSHEKNARWKLILNEAVEVDF